ncbi:uncharacterized protein [Nicotiana tomentosiformis]|uniref:uncharacterized protein n=1 Tax=Nicotiana tomentosiformis TaxID=4098 RepID=UPI00388CD46C
MSSEALLRLDKFTKLFPIHFSGAPSKDPQDYLDHCQEVSRNIGIVEINGVNFIVFQMIGSAISWWRDYMLTRPASSPPLTLDQFSQLFLEKFTPFTLREDYHRQFERLQQGSMTVTQYETQFVDLARHAIILLPNERERGRRFIDDLTLTIKIQVAKETGDDIYFQRAVEMSIRIEMVRGQERGLYLIRSLVILVVSVVPRLEARVLSIEDTLPGHFNQCFRHPMVLQCTSNPEISEWLTRSTGPVPGSLVTVTKGFLYLWRSEVPFQILPISQGGMHQQGYRAIISSPVASPPAQPARGGGQATRGKGPAIRGGGQPAKGRPRGSGHSGGAQPHFHAFPTRLEAESSDAVITYIVLVFHRYASVLFDPVSTYPYVSSYFASYLVVPRDSLSAHVYVSMHVGYSIIVDHVYCLCMISIGSLETSVYLLLLDMVDFDVILGIDWLSPYHSILDCDAKMAMLAMSGVPRLECRGALGHSTQRVISYMKSRRMVEKGCLAYLAYICDSTSEVPFMDSILVVREFSEVFLADLLGMQPDRHIDFYIDLAHGHLANFYSTIPYGLTRVEGTDGVVTRFA